MKEKIFDDMNPGPFKARVDERFHKLGQDCPDNGWVEGYLYRDLNGGEVAPFIFNCPCRWRVVEETIAPIGFGIIEWKTGTPEAITDGPYHLVTIKGKNANFVSIDTFEKGHWRSGMNVIAYCPILSIKPPKED